MSESVRKAIEDIIKDSLEMEHFMNDEGPVDDERLDLYIEIIEALEEDFQSFSEWKHDPKEKIEAAMEKIQHINTELEKIKRDQKKLDQENAQKNNELLFSMKQNQNLDMYFSFGHMINKTQSVYVQFFTKEKKEDDSYSVKLEKIFKNESSYYVLESTNPTLKNLKQLKRMLERSNHLGNILCRIRASFYAHKFRNAPAPVGSLHHKLNCLKLNTTE
ncbi:uncharacterized protein LOC112046329 [Bicyclus anynana]|uniref:Kinetochore protein SPC25 n=1 Tax=Bicyclus anynana TaxID=110368 RepID=A0ABM3M5E8_BICAN|nr:uncharacterized protein LOC112046329 [Bicyclus anynana]